MKIKGLAMEILELIAVLIDFPCCLINRFECSSRNVYRIICRLIDAGLIKRFRKDKMGSLRLTQKGQAYLLEHDRGRIGKIEDKIKYSKSEEEKRRRLHRIASAYISMRNAGVKIYTDQKPIVFSKNKVDEVKINEPVFYSSLEIKSVGIECTKIKYCRAVGLLLASDDRGFIVYNSQNTLMKWSSTAEQRVSGTLTGLLLDCGIQINHFYGLMVGKDMEFAKRLLFSDGGLKNELFKLDNTFYEFYYVPEDENGDYLISLLVDNKRLKDMKRQLIDELEIKIDFRPYSSDGKDKYDRAILFAYDFDLEKIRKFKSGLEMFEEIGIVVCFEFQKKVLEEYFGGLADFIVIQII